MSRDARLYLSDILDAGEAIVEFIQGADFDAFVEDRKTRDSVVRNLTVIGEAAKHLTEDVRDAMPEIEWRSIAGMRDILVHEYFGLSLPIVWDAAANKVPPLVAAVKRYLGT